MNAPLINEYINPTSLCFLIEYQIVMKSLPAVEPPNINIAEITIAETILNNEAYKIRIKNLT
jgi:hypothetical protein